MYGLFGFILGAAGSVMLTLKTVVENPRRKHQGQVSRGDGVRASLDLTGVPAIKKMIGPGYELGTSALLLPALAAATALADEWEPRRLSMEWLKQLPVRGTVTVECDVTKLSRELMAVAFKGEIDGKCIYRGEIEFGPKPPPLVVSGPLFTILEPPRVIALNNSAKVSLHFSSPAHVELTLPPGHGLRAPGGKSFEVPAGALEIELIADRPHFVNLGKPWPVGVAATTGEKVQTVELLIQVPDPEPGRRYYILTEDCETFDGGPLTGNYGAAGQLGNHNNFMDPEDYLVQMVAKPGRMNDIAEKHGAVWTHFWAAHHRFAADWAITQSTSGKWKEVAEALDESICRGSIRHEYAPHLHCDYEPNCELPPQPRLMYDAETDGILPNDYYDPVTNPTHKYHDWDGAARGGPGIKALGSWDNIDSKTGSLFKVLNYLSRLQVHNRSVLCGRTGSYDFGLSPEDQRISTCAYQTLGMFGNSDARFPAGDTIEGGHLYRCRSDDRFHPIQTLEEEGLIQFAVTNEVAFESTEGVNDWFKKHAEACNGPGVHGIVLTTHAMFMRGEPDPFRSLEGGAFANLDEHLRWVRDNFPDVEFATASEAAIEFIDYYTTELVAIVDPRLVAGEPRQGTYSFGVHLLGKGIHVSEDSPAVVVITAPACFRPSEVLRVEVRQGGETLAHSNNHTISVRLTRRDVPVMFTVSAREEAVPGLADLFLRCIAHPFHDFPERPKPVLLQTYSASQILSLLTNPVAGADQPANERRSVWLMLLAGAALFETREMRKELSLDFVEASFSDPGAETNWRSVSASRVEEAVEAVFTDGGNKNTAVFRFRRRPAPDRRGARFLQSCLEWVGNRFR